MSVYRTTLTLTVLHEDDSLDDAHGRLCCMDLARV